MSDKRFQVIDDGFSKWIIDTTLKEDRHEGTLYTAYDMCCKLNELYEENEQLRKENFFLAKQRNYWKGKCDVAVETFEIDEATAKKISELEEENEQLKSELNDCAVILYSVFGEMNYLNYKSDPVILKKYKELFDDD